MKRSIVETRNEESIVEMINAKVQQEKLKIIYINEQIYFDRNKKRNFRVFIYSIPENNEWYFIKRQRILSRYLEPFKIQDKENVIAIIEQGFFMYPDDKNDKKTPAKHMKHVIIYGRKN